MTRNRSETCSICLELGADCKGSGCRTGHWFHPHCLDQWSETTTECPVCKKHITKVVTRHGYAMRQYPKRARQLAEEAQEAQAAARWEEEWALFQQMMQVICNRDSNFVREDYDLVD